MRCNPSQLRSTCSGDACVAVGAQHRILCARYSDAPNQPRRRRRHYKKITYRTGFTLLELLVVGIIGTMVLGVIANVWRWYGHSIAEQQMEVMLAQELKVASDAIAQDYGLAIASRTTDGDSLQMDLDGGAKDGAAQWTDPDSVIQYEISSSKLLRRNLTATTSVPLAGHMKSISVNTVSGHLQVTITAEFRNNQRSITLRLTGT